MTHPTIIVRAKARTDIVEYASWIHQDSAEAAARFVEATYDTIRKLADHSGMGAVRQSGEPALEGIRVWPIAGFRNHLIFYLPIDDGVDVIRVLHASRDQTRLLKIKHD